MKRKLLLAALCVVGAMGGVNSLHAQTDVTSTYLTNPSFETDGSKEWNPSNNSTISITGWTVNLGNPGGTYDNTGIYDSSHDSSAGFGKRVTPADGTYYFFNRRGWGTVTNTLTTTSKIAVPIGNYVVSAKYKIAYSDNNGGSKKPTLTIKAVQNESVLATKTSVGGPKGPGDSYFNTSEWQEITIPFSVNTAGNVNFVLSVYLDGGHGRGDILLDDVRLYDLRQASSSSLVDCSGFINNQLLANNNTDGWTATTTYTSWSANGFSEGNKQQWNGNFSFSQALSGLPNGKYKLTVQGFYRPGANGAALSAQNALLFAGDSYSTGLKYVSSEAKAEVDNTNGFTTAYGDLGYVPNSQADAKKAFASGAYNNELAFYVTNHEITVGTKKETLIGNDWTVWDNFKLYLQALAIENYAETYTAVTAVEADKWYVYNVSASGDYRFISNVANTITYTQTGTDIDEDVSTTQALTADTKKVVALTAGKVYFKVSADATLTVEPDAYAYSVGAGTTSVADNGYTQSKTMTVTFADATTNDPDGALSIIDATKIKVNGTAAAASITGNVLTITLADALATSTDYAVSIETGAVGYNADNKNTSAVELTVKTPAVFDGTYFIATTDGKKFISRGGDSNTEATLDEFGVPVEITTDAENVSLVRFLDANLYFYAGSKSVYTDKTTAAGGDNVKWTIAAYSTGYSFHTDRDRSSETNKGNYVVAGTGAESSKEAATYGESAYAWTLVDPAAHAATVAAYKDANAKTVASAAGLSATTVDALETALTSSFTSSNIDVTEAYSSPQDKYQTYGDVMAKQTLTDLKSGIYKVTLYGYQRMTWNEGTYAGYQNNAEALTAYLYANDEKIQLPSVMSEYNSSAYTAGTNPNYSPVDGKNYPNSKEAAGQAFDAGRYKVEVFALVTDGTLNIGVYSPSKYTNGNWICYRSLSVTRYVFNGDYSDLNTAITSAEANIGFETGEYAPYNNVVSMGKLATAKALYASQDGINQDAIDAVTDALTGATWSSANATEVNAIYDGTFAAATNDGAPAGWISTTHELGGSGHSRAFVGDNRLSEFNGTKSAFFIRYDGTWSNAGSLYNYGTTDGYTMPLKANTYYYIQADFAGWGSKGNPLKMLVTGPNDFSATSGTVNTSYNADTESEYTPQQFYFVFETSAAGNYVIKFQNPSNKTHMAVVSNIELKKCNASATMLVKAGQWGTFIAPFDVTIPDGVNAYTVTGVNANDYMVKEAVETTIQANTPVLLENTTEDPVNTTFYGKDLSDADSYTKGLLTGIYTAATIPAGSYVLQTPKSTEVQAFYPLATTLTGTPNRCYLTLPNFAAKRNAIFFDKEEGTTSIEAPNATNGEDGVFYNLAGQRVNRSYKGIIIHNRKAKLNN